MKIKCLKPGVLMLGLICSFSACSEQEEKVDPVDLRYRVEDAYELEAIGPAEISFIVKSSDPWEVYSYHPDWCSVDPASGDPGEQYTVNVRYNDNGELDDRVDTLVIKSDYWIGKTVQVYQKGIAYLSVDAEELVLDRNADNAAFNVSSNQKWSTEVTSGSEWLRIDRGSEGELDGEVSVSAETNTGEKRYGTVTVFDRHGVPSAVVSVEQDGAQLDPSVLEIRALHDETKVVLHVVSNTEWTAYKDDESVLWYSFENPVNEGTADLVINLEPNTSNFMKEATFTLRTTADEGSTPAVRTITIKQANESVPVRYDFKDGIGSWTLNNGSMPAIGSGGGLTFDGAARLVQSNMPAGTYTFRVKTNSSDAIFVIYYVYSGSEVRFFLDAGTGKTNISTSPWFDYSGNNVEFDPAVAHDLTVEMSEAEGGFMLFEWYFDGVKIAERNSSELAGMTWMTPSTIYFGTSAGNATCEWYEYTAPIVWE